MKHARLAIAICGLSVLLAAETPVCRRILLPKPHHSKATLARWAEWNKTHIPPTPKQILRELDLACPPVATVDISENDFVLPMDAPVWIYPEITPETAVLPQVEVAESGYVIPAISLQVAYAPASAPIPEPSSIYLLLTGAALCGAVVKSAEVTN